MAELGCVDGAAILNLPSQSNHPIPASMKKSMGHFVSISSNTGMVRLCSFFWTHFLAKR